MKKHLGLLLVLIGTLLLPLTAQAAPSAQTIKANMKKRLPAITALLESGALGEAATGFLAIRGELSAADKSLVAAENADRKLIYEAIARKEQASAQLVGERRAKQIFDRAKPGTWLQDSNGNWKQK